MKKSFKYFLSTSYLDDIDVEDIGNCIVQGNCDNGACYYLWVKTIEGSTKVLEIGPCVLDKGLSVFVKRFNVSYSTMNYSESKIATIINKFLNNSSYEITQAFEISEETLKENCIIDIYDFMKDEF